MDYLFLFYLFQTREHCLGLIEGALKANFQHFYRDIPHRLSAADYEPRCSAIDAEYEVFRTSKMANLYKVSVMKVVNEVKKCTKCGELHIAFVPQSDGIKTEESDAERMEEKHVLECKEVAGSSVSIENSDSSSTSGAISSTACDTSVEYKSRNVKLENSEFEPSHSHSVMAHSAFVKASDLYNIGAKGIKTEECDKKNSVTERGDFKRTVPKIKYFFERDDLNDTKDTETSGLLDQNDSVPSVCDKSSSLDHRISDERGTKRKGTPLTSEVLVVNYS